MSASPQTFGHTGFTGTCVWMDPVQNISFVFLSNRVYPDGGSNNKISQLNIRPKIMEVIYEAMR
jgi:CubicO group peptidase (beta-lactamase class C family)